MPRYPRIFVPGIPLHIVQRGHDRQRVFGDPDDFACYLDNLGETKTEFGIRLLAYCLMSNHVHLIVVPGDDASLISNMMRVVAARQTRRANARWDRSGTLWEGRFKASLIDTDRYLLECYRYVELNPVRAAIVSYPDQYPWSSYRAHAGILDDPLVDRHDTYDALGGDPEDRAEAYRRFVADPADDSKISRIREALQRNQLTGGCRFERTIHERTGRRVYNRGPGRPRDPAGRLYDDPNQD